MFERLNIGNLPTGTPPKSTCRYKSQRNIFLLKINQNTNTLPDLFCLSENLVASAPFDVFTGKSP